MQVIAYYVRISIIFQTSPLEVSLYHYPTWTERGRPDSLVLFNLLSEVDKLKQHQQTNSPVMVACK